MARKQASSSLLGRWARFVHRRRGTVIGAWVVALVALIALSSVYGGEFDSGFAMPGTESQKAIDLFRTQRVLEPRHTRRTVCDLLSDARIADRPDSLCVQPWPQCLVGWRADTVVA